jgi:putative sterol carrier protein
MTIHLSPAWLEAAATLVAEDVELQRLRPDPPLVLAQIVTADDRSDEVLASWQVTFGSDGAVWRTGPAPLADVTFTCTAATAWEITAGQLSAQAAFMAGELRIGGDTSMLLANRDLLVALHDALAPLRATTTRRDDA